MIHTFEIKQTVNCQKYALDIASRLKFSQKDIQGFRAAIQSGKKGKGIYRSDICKEYPGIKRVALCFFRDEISCQYAFYLQIEPWMFLLGRRIIELYQPTEENNEKLQEKFTAMMEAYLGRDYPQFTMLCAWQCRRIDYTKNFRFATSEQAQVFLDLTKKTSSYCRRTKRYIKNQRQKEQSTAEGNNSLKVIFYDKEKEIGAMALPDEKKEHLKNDAMSVIRYEVQCRKPKISQLKQKYRLSDRSVCRFLDETISDTVLFDCYEQTVGFADFYELRQAQQRLNGCAEISATCKKRMFNLLQLIAQARHLDIARRQFIAETAIKHSKPDLTVGGCDSTFRKYLNVLEENGINPVPIPKDWKVPYLENPIHQ